MKLLEKYESFRDGELAICKQSKSSYQGRIYLGRVSKKVKYIYKSIKTKDREYAIAELKNWFDEVQYLKRNNKELPISNQKNRFITYSKDYIDNFDRKDNATHKDDNKYHEHLMYWIKTEKIKQVGFKPERKIEDAFNDFKIKYEAGEIKNYNSEKYSNYKLLLNSKKMQEEVFFKEL